MSGWKFPSSGHLRTYFFPCLLFSKLKVNSDQAKQHSTHDASLPSFFPECVLRSNHWTCFFILKTVECNLKEILLLFPTCRITILSVFHWLVLIFSITVIEKLVLALWIPQRTVNPNSIWSQKWVRSTGTKYC